MRAFAQQLPTDPFNDPAFEAALPPLDATEANFPTADLVEQAQTSDAELAAPLLPVATFDMSLPAQQAEVENEKMSEIRYRLAITGLKEVGLESRFRDLSALLQDGRKAANAAQVSARADEDAQLAMRLLRSEGYLDGFAAADVGAVPDARGELPVVLNAAPGTRYMIGQIRVTGTPPEPERLTREALSLSTGDPIVAAGIETAEARVALRLPEQGYPFVAVGERDILLDDATHRGDYTLPVRAGPRSSFGAFRTAGDLVFGIDHIALLPRFKAGELYDSRKVDDLRQSLVATSLFSTVAIEPVRTGTVNADGTETVDLLVRQTKGPWRSLSASAGYGTGEGARLSASWTHRNLFPPEGALTVAALAGTQEQSLSTIFRRSNAGQRDRTFQAKASVARQRFDAYNAETVDLSANLSRSSTPIWQKRWTYSVGAEIVASRETRFDATRLDRTRNTYFIATLPLQLGYDRSNNLLDPTTGFRITARISPEAQKRSGGGGGVGGYARTLFEASGYLGVTSNVVLAGRARVGSIVGIARDDIAPSRRLYAGGGGSVRGFGYQQLGPKDIDANPVGGRSLTEFAAEARYRFGDYGIVAFVDAGRVGDGSMPSISGMRYGAGLGARYYTNFGPLRIDVATPLGRRRGESLVALYLSIGQAF